jgi:hypothetical protein
VNPSFIEDPGVNPSFIEDPGVNSSFIEDPGVNPSFVEDPDVKLSVTDDPDVNSSVFENSLDTVSTTVRNRIFNCPGLSCLHNLLSRFWTRSPIQSDTE